MKRTKQGLIFDSAAEEKAYNDKKEAFLSRTDEQNAAIFSSELKRTYKEFFNEE